MMPYTAAAEAAAADTAAAALTLAALPLVWLLLYTAHRVGDHWLQTTHQAVHKGRPGAHGALVCVGHAAVVTAVQGGAVLAVAVPLLAVLAPGSGVITPAGMGVGLAITLVSHTWADRRHTLANLATALKQAEFFQFGAALGSGSYALDQDWHRAWLIPSAVAMVAPPPVLATTAALSAGAMAAAALLARVGSGMDAEAQVAAATRA